jgi:aldose 1-epimerase
MEPISCIVLRKGALSVGVAPQSGASLTRFDVSIGTKRRDILRPARSPRPGLPASLGASCFPLVPYAGRLREGRFEFEGRPIVYPLNALPERNSSHGDGFTRPWALTQLERHRATLEILPDASAPIQYHCSLTIEVSDDRLHVGMTVRNLENRRIPLGLGLHPYFANRSGATLKANLPVQWNWDAELMPTTSGPNQRRAEFEHGVPAAQLPIAAQYCDWDGQADIEWPADGLRVRLVTRPALAHVVTWTPVGEEFFCFEPLSHATDSFNLGRPGPGMEPIVLEPGALYEQCFTFIVNLTNPPEPK